MSSSWSRKSEVFLTAIPSERGAARAPFFASTSRQPLAHIDDVVQPRPEPVGGKYAAAIAQGMAQGGKLGRVQQAGCGQHQGDHRQLTDLNTDIERGQGQRDR